MARATKLQQGKNGKLTSKKSRTGDPLCSKAMSTWKTTGMTPEVASILGKCRAKARMKTQAKAQEAAGNTAKAQVLEKRAERGLTVKDRLAKAKELVAQRRAMAAKAAPQSMQRGSQERVDIARIKRAEYRLATNTRLGRNTASESTLASTANDSISRLGATKSDLVKSARESARAKAKSVVAKHEEKSAAKIKDMFSTPKWTPRSLGRTPQEQDLAEKFHSMPRAQKLAEARRLGISGGSKMYDNSLTQQMAKTAAKAAPAAQATAKPSLLEQAKAKRAATPKPAPKVYLTGEKIGESKPWVAEISSFGGKYGAERKFLTAARDYSGKNSVGSRGVESTFELQRGKLYEANIPKSWKRTDRTFKVVTRKGEKNLSGDRAMRYLRLKNRLTARANA